MSQQINYNNLNYVQCAYIYIFGKRRTEFLIYEKNNAGLTIVKLFLKSVFRKTTLLR